MGFASKYFASKREVFKPDQERFISVKPKTFQKEDLWIGNILKLEGFKFRLISADEYCLRYMELHNQEFPKSNTKLILDKIRKKLRPIYKDFVNCYLKPCLESYENTGSVLSFCNLRKALFELLEDDITEHEIITIARQFRLQDQGEKFTKTEIVNVCRTECQKMLWLGFDRLRENLHYKDPCCTGFVPQRIAFSLCKGAKIPIQNDLLDIVMKTVDRNECGEVSINDLLNFFDTEGNLLKPTAPFSHKKEFSQLEILKKSTDYYWIDGSCLLESIGLEEKLAKDGHVEETKNVILTPDQVATMPH